MTGTAPGWGTDRISRELEAVPIDVGRKRRRDDILQVGAAPILLRQDIVRLGE